MTYQDAVNGAERSLSTGIFAKADIFITRHGGERFLIKDFGARRCWERNSIGRLLIWRENRAYAGLIGVPGIPGRCLRLTPFCLAIEYLEGTHFSGVERREIMPATIGQLEGIIAGIHARGWVHLDLHRRKNLLLVDGRVFVIDLASAFHTGGVPLAGRLLTRIVGTLDRLAIMKFKAIFAPEMLTPGERRLRRLRNLLFRTPWEEQTMTVRKERKPAAGPEARRFHDNGSAVEVSRQTRTWRQTLENKLGKITPSTVLIGFAGIIVYWFAREKSLLASWFLPGALLVIAGEGLRLWAAGHLRKNRQVTSSGPYAYVKNPLYIGTLFIGTGFGAMAMNPWLIGACAAWFTLLYAPYKKKREHTKLATRFGEAWAAYDRAVPDYLPRLKPYPGRNIQRWRWSAVKDNSEHETAAAVVLGLLAMLYLFLR